jgi:hypothetical protein
MHAFTRPPTQHQTLTTPDQPRLPARLPACPPAGVEDNGALTRVAAFPIGIDPDRFTEALETPEVKANIAQLLNRCAQLVPCGRFWWMVLVAVVVAGWCFSSVSAVGAERRRGCVFSVRALGSGLG